MANTNKTSNDIIVTMEDFFKKAPALPANAREFIVKITPWFAIIFGVLGVLAGLAAVGVSPVAVLGGVQAGASTLISGVLAIVTSVIMIMAYPKLKNSQMAGWKLLFWSQAVSVLSSLLAGGLNGIVGTVVGALIGFYILFQIKSYYK
jgi:Zn-dependent protease with chaperone function